MRSMLCLIVLISYSAFFTAYLIGMKNPNIPLQTLKLLYYTNTLLMFCFTIYDLKTGFESQWHKDFNNICIAAIIINNVLMILVHFQVLDDKLTEILIFNGSVFATSLFVLISGGRHNEFND